LDEAVSLTTYSEKAVTDVQFTHTYGRVRQAMNAYSAHFNSGNTNIAAGIDVGRNSFARGATRTWAAKVIVLLTDGMHNLPPDPIASAQHAADKKIMIFTVTFAKEADQALMKRIAEIGLGKHYHAAIGSELVAVFQDIARSLPILITR
jgi:Mg-chelatase subunit ChlD